jgi:hypothetical protein
LHRLNPELAFGWTLAFAAQRISSKSIPVAAMISLIDLPVLGVPEQLLQPDGVRTFKDENDKPVTIGHGTSPCWSTRLKICVVSPCH